MVCSLTRTAAAEVAGRDLPISKDAIGTLHSHAYRALGQGKIEIADDPKHLFEWNKAYPNMALSAGRILDEDNSAPSFGPTEADQAYADYNNQRARMVMRDHWQQSTLFFAKTWEHWKHEQLLLDFTDLLETALQETETAPNNPGVIFGDEAQDFSALELALLQKWSAAAGRLVITGDPWQCQPTGTQVLTINGYKSIEQLDPNLDRLVSFNQHAREVVGLRNGYTFQKAARHYQGCLFTISARGRSTQCTPEHKWEIKWTDKSHSLQVVYLMRRGTWWRIGYCQLFTDDGNFHLSVRTRLERADDIWVLQVLPNKKEAAIQEAITATRFGLPMICFDERVNTLLKAEDLARVFEAFDPGELEARAESCLNYFNRDRRFPMWSTEALHEKRGITRCQVIHTCNLLPQIMSIPYHCGGQVASWEPINITSNHFNGTVYSLEVSPNKYYLADGLVTHNCLYGWRGADANVVFPPDQQPDRVLNQSYRVPVAVHAAAMRWIEKMPGFEPIEYNPTDAPGWVVGIAATADHPEIAADGIDRALSDGKTVMYLASCSRMLRPMLTVLRERGVPFHNSYRRAEGAWNPLQARHTAKGAYAVTGAQRLAAFLRMGVEGVWTKDDVRRWGAVVKGSETFADSQSWKRLEPLVNNIPDGPIDLSLWEMLLGEASVDASMSQDLDWWLEHLLASRRDAAQYPVNIARARGRDGLLIEPTLTVGTIHSVKGGEADVVIIAPDVSVPGAAEWAASDVGKASIYRLFYVALTRAKESVHIMQPVKPSMAVRLI